MIKYLRRALARRRARRIQPGGILPTPWDAWKLDAEAEAALRRSVEQMGQLLAADFAKRAAAGELWQWHGGPAALLNRRDYRAWMDELGVTAGIRVARNSAEGIAIMRATIAASPYQQCRSAHGCEHPCSCPIRKTTTEGEGS